MPPGCRRQCACCFLGGPLRRSAATSCLPRCFTGAVDEEEEIIKKGAPRSGAAVGDLVRRATHIYLIAVAVPIALVGTAFPILLSRKDTCPECDGAGFIRNSGKSVAVGADDLGQIDK